MKKERKPNGYWHDIENIRKEAKKYKTKIEFRKECSTGYREAVQHKIIDELFESLHRPNGFWNDKKVIRDYAKLCNSKYEFRIRYSSGYNKALEYGMIGELFEDSVGVEVDDFEGKPKKEEKTKKSTRRKPGYWNILENIKKHAKECSGRNDFSRKYNAGYNNAKKRGILDELFPYTTKPKGYWDNLDNVREHAKKYSSRNEFRLGCGSGYNVARENHMLDDMFGSLRKPDGYWNEENVRKHAKECIYKTDFEEKYYSGYLKALELGIIDELYPNKNVHTLFKDKPHIVYRYTLSNPDGKDFVYIGITQNEQKRKYTHTINSSLKSQVKTKLEEGYLLKEYKVLERELSFEDADSLETKLIGKYINDENYVCINKALKGNIKKY